MPGIDGPADKVTHMIAHRDVLERARGPGGWIWDCRGQEAEDEQSDAQGETCHGGDDLAPRQGGCEASCPLRMISRNHFPKFLKPITFIFGR